MDEARGQKVQGEATEPLESHSYSPRDENGACREVLYCWPLAVVAFHRSLGTLWQVRGSHRSVLGQEDIE